MDLLANPFHILNATPFDSRTRIMELADEKSLLLNSNDCIQARSDLTHPRKRVAIEVAWLPGVEPTHVSELFSLLVSSPENVFNLTGLPPMARANLLAAGLVRLPTHASSDITEWILAICLTFESICAKDLTGSINNERSVAGFPQLLDSAAVEDEINERRKYYRSVINSVLDSLHPEKMIRTLSFVVKLATKNGKIQGPILLDDLIDSYEVEVQAFLNKEEEEIIILVDKLRTAVSSIESDASILAITNQLILGTKNWVGIARPIQISANSRGLDHKASHRVACFIRALSVDMNNKYGKLKLSMEMTKMLSEVFADATDIVNLCAKDIETLNAIFGN